MVEQMVISGQSGVIDFLEEQYRIDKERFFTEAEIEKYTGMRDCSTPMRALRKHGEVEYRTRPRPKRGGPGPKEYRFKPDKK